MIHNENELIECVEKLGFLPFFTNNIKGFSLEEMCPPELWFTELEGPWEWKGPAAKSGKCIYGKFFRGKAGFISREWIGHFANYRRDGYDFDARCDDGLVFYKDEELYNTIDSHKTILSKALKDIHNYKKGGNKGFDTVITRLQMQMYVCVSDFVYNKDKHGNPYGWGITEYTTPEHLIGESVVRSEYSTHPNTSKALIVEHLKSILPDVSEKEIIKLIKI